MEVKKEEAGTLDFQNAAGEQKLPSWLLWLYEFFNQLLHEGH